MPILVNEGIVRSKKIDVATSAEVQITRFGLSTKTYSSKGNGYSFKSSLNAE